jgi:hypothetical protein
LLFCEVVLSGVNVEDKVDKVNKVDKVDRNDKIEIGW